MGYDTRVWVGKLRIRFSITSGFGVVNRTLKALNQMTARTTISVREASHYSRDKSFLSKRHLRWVELV